MKTCKTCGTDFEPINSFQKCSDWKCTLSQAQVKNGKKRKKEFNRETKRRKQAAKTRSTWIKECQVAFNAYIRGRDKGQNCISCGLSESELKINSPIVLVCGHYLSVGAHPELRFEPLVAHLQCTRCNGGSGKYGTFNNKAETVTQQYRVNLIKKIGQDKVDWLEGPHEPKKYTIDELKLLKQEYKDKLKDMLK